MGTLTDAEVEYPNSQPLGRLVTVGPDGRSHVTPVGVFYDPETQTIVVGGHASSDMAASKKFRDARRRPDVAFVADDPASVDPWTPRFVEVRGRAEAHTDGGEAVSVRIGAGMPFDPAWIRISPRRIVAMGLEGGGPFELNARDVA